MANKSKFIIFGIIGFGILAIVFAAVKVIGVDTVMAKNSRNHSVTIDSQKLNGKWYRGEGSSYVDPVGKTRWGVGARFSYEFLPDGMVEYKTDRNAKSVMQCDIIEKKSRKGKYSVSGDTITIEFGEMNFFSSDSCIEKDNFDKTLPAETVTIKVKIQTEYEKIRLYIQDENGEFPYDKFDE